MFRKVALSTLLLGLIAVLIAGAIIRTVDKTENVEARGLGQGRGAGQEAGETITLRDEVGRPAWAGGGQSAQANARGGYEGQGYTEAPGDGTGTGQAQVDEWVTLQGNVVSVDGNALIVQTTDGQEIVVENRAWWFAQEQGFSIQVGDQVTLVGFYEGGDFETGQMVNITTGQSVLIREEGGRPLWAGRGRRGR